MRHLALTFLAVLPVYFTSVAATLTNQTCMDACYQWSSSITHCRAVYGMAPENRTPGIPGVNYPAGYTNYTYANEFLSCLCRGEMDGYTIGNDSVNDNAGVCMGCATTPSIVVKDLTNLLTLCAVVATNGSAAGALTYVPDVYTTNANQTVYGGVGQETTQGNVNVVSPSSGARPLVQQVGMGVVALGVVGGAVMSLL